MSRGSREFGSPPVLHVAGSSDTVPLRSSLEDDLSYGSIDSAHDDTAGLLRTRSTIDVRNVPADALSRWSQGPQLAIAGQADSRRTLGMFAGVFSPVALSMFSALLFLRIGSLLTAIQTLLTLLYFCSRDVNQIRISRQVNRDFPEFTIPSDFTQHSYIRFRFAITKGAAILAGCQKLVLDQDKMVLIVC